MFSTIIAYIKHILIEIHRRFPSDSKFIKSEKKKSQFDSTHHNKPELSDWGTIYPIHEPSYLQRENDHLNLKQQRRIHTLNIQ